MKHKFRFGILLTLSLILSFNLFDYGEVNAEDNNDNFFVLNENQRRPYRIWVTAERSYSGRVPLTIQHEIVSYGARYKGTLSLQKGFHGAGIAKYAGYVYNTNNNYIPLRKDKVI